MGEQNIQKAVKSAMDAAEAALSGNKPFCVTHVGVGLDTTAVRGYQSHGPEGTCIVHFRFIVKIMLVNCYSTWHVVELFYPISSLRHPG